MANLDTQMLMPQHIKGHKINIGNTLKIQDENIQSYVFTTFHSNKRVKQGRLSSHFFKQQNILRRTATADNKRDTSAHIAEKVFSYISRRRRQGNQQLKFLIQEAVVTQNHLQENHQRVPCKLSYSNSLLHANSTHEPFKTLDESIQTPNVELKRLQNTKQDQDQQQNGNQSSNLALRAGRFLSRRTLLSKKDAQALSPQLQQQKSSSRIAFDKKFIRQDSFVTNEGDEFSYYQLYSRKKLEFENRQQRANKSFFLDRGTINTQKRDTLEHPQYSNYGNKKELCNWFLIRRRALLQKNFRSGSAASGQMHQGGSPLHGRRRVSVSKKQKTLGVNLNSTFLSAYVFNQSPDLSPLHPNTPSPSRQNLHTVSSHVNASFVDNKIQQHTPKKVPINRMFEKCRQQYAYRKGARRILDTELEESKILDKSAQTSASPVFKFSLSQYKRQKSVIKKKGV